MTNVTLLRKYVKRKLPFPTLANAIYPLSRVYQLIKDYGIETPDYWSILSTGNRFVF